MPYLRGRRGDQEPEFRGQEGIYWQLRHQWKTGGEGKEVVRTVAAGTEDFGHERWEEVGGRCQGLRLLKGGSESDVIWVGNYVLYLRSTGGWMGML